MPIAVQCVYAYGIRPASITTVISPLSSTKPTITASSQNICPGTTVTFLVSSAGAISYLWYINGVSTGATSANYSYSDLKDKDQVTCYVTDASGGALSDPIVLTVGDDRKPSVTISATSANICKGTPVTFTALPVNGGTSPILQWRVNDIHLGSGLTYTTSALQNSDVVTCVIISNADCVIPEPISSYAISMNVSEIVKPAGKIFATATSICAGTTIDLSMNMSVGEPVSYLWKVNGVARSTLSTFSIGNLADKDIVSCDMVVNTSCSSGIVFSPADLSISVMPDITPGVVISSSASNGVCAGTPVTFTAAAYNAGYTAKYQWMVNNINTGTNSKVFTSSALNNADIINCKITPQSVPCLLTPSVISDPLIIKVFPLPVIGLPASQKIAAGSSIVLSPVISGDVSSYLWSPDAGLSSASVKNPIASPQFNTTYSLTVVSTNGCVTTGTTTVNLSGGKIIVKNAFTPNGDGVNDTWEISNLVNYSDCTVDIFDRYGTKIFHANGYPNAWDGRRNSKMLPQGVYYYIIDLKDGSKALTGALTLIR